MSSLVFDDDVLGEHHFLWYDVHFRIRLLLFDSLQIILDLVQLLVIRKVHQFLISRLKVLILRIVSIGRLRFLEVHGGPFPQAIIDWSRLL